MRRLRRFVRRLAKPAAMVAAVGILSLSLVVTTPSNAQAFSDGDLLQKAAPRIAGAVKTIAPVAGPIAAVATSVTPLGWALKGAYSLAMLAFSTSDIWMPWILDAGSSFGKGGNGNTTANGAAIDPNLSITSAYKTGLDTYTFDYATVAPQHTTAVNFYISYALKCSSNADGTGTQYPKTGYANSSYIKTGVRTGTLSGKCTYGHLVGAVAGPVGGSPELTAAGPAGAGPVNVVRFGTAVDASVGSFNPAGPEVGYQGRSECIDSTGTVSWISGPTISGAAGGVQMPSCEAAGKGHGTGRTQVIAFKPDGTQQPVWDVPVAPSDPSTPMCDPGKSSGGCVLSVELDGKGCEAGNVECENWSEIQKNDPGNTRLKCRFGPYTLPMSACNLLEQAYRAGGALATERNIDGDPATQDNNNYAGQPVPQPAAPPVVGTTPGGAPAPGSSGQTAPNADAKDKQCFPTGWAAFNPLEWIVKPMRCLFEPSKDISQMGQIFREKAKVKAPIHFITAISGMEAPSGGGCPNWVVKVGENFSQNAVCNSSFTQAILGIRAPLFGIVAVAMIWPLLRGIWYASIPILRVTPTGGK